MPFRLTAPQVDAACRKAQADAERAAEALICVPDAKRTFANSFAALDALQGDFLSATQPLNFLKDVHPDAAVRAAGAACEARSSQFLVELMARRDVYQALKAYLAHAGAHETLGPVDQRLVFLTLREFRRNGLELSEDKRQRLVGLRTRLAELGTRFESNLDENQDALELTRAELQGLPADYIARLARTPQGRLRVTMHYPDYFPLMENARSEAVRKRAYLMFNAREAARNTPLLVEAVALRDEAAHLLGYRDHLDFVTEARMAHTGQAVNDFLEKVWLGLHPGRDALVEKLTALKRAQTHDSSARLESWDTAYELGVYKKRHFAIDDEQVRRYFPADRVLAGMFQVYERVLHVRFRPVPGADVWADGVSLYEVQDEPSGRLLARFYVDLFPRAGKYGHAASFPLVPGRERAGGYQVPLTALVVNFNPPAAGTPSHLALNEVETLFHEFGHVMHECLTTSPYATLAGSSVALDFVEAPSQMLQNWVYQPEVLALISRDPAHPGEPMPQALAQKLAAARTFDAGLMFTRQVFLASLDAKLHSSGRQVDPDAVDRELRPQLTGFPTDPSEHFAATFGHLMSGYDGGYYGYLWSLVYAQDMFTRFAREGIFSPEVGRAYRDVILAPGRTEEADVLLRRFLGRPPSDEAFLVLAGVQRQTSAANP